MTACQIGEKEAGLPSSVFLSVFMKSLERKDQRNQAMPGRRSTLRPSFLQMEKKLATETTKVLYRYSSRTSGSTCRARRNSALLNP